MKKGLLLVYSAMIAILSIQCSDEDVDSRLDYATSLVFDVSDINKDGVTFNGEVIAGTKEEVVNHGFVWGQTEQETTFNAERQDLGPLVSGKYKQRITANLEKGRTYYVRSFVVSNDGTRNHTYYSKTISFVSLGSVAPTIFDFTPHQFNIGDVITIKGKNFNSNLFKNVVRFGNVMAGIVTATDSLLTVVVPDSLAEIKVPISVSVFGNKGISNQVYDINPPVIDNFYPSSATNDSQISIYGKNFVRGKTTISCANTKFRIDYISGNLINATLMSGGAKQNPLTVKVFDKVVLSLYQFTNYSIEIKSIEPLVGTFDDFITVRGYNINDVYFNNYYYAETQMLSDSVWLVKVPENLNSSQATISATSSGWLSLTYPNPFTLKAISVNSFSPSSGSVGTSVTITGNNFSPSPSNCYVLFGGVQASVTSASKNEIVVQVPWGVPSNSTLTVHVADQSVTLPNTFTLTQ